MIVEIHGNEDLEPVFYGTVETTPDGVVFKIDDPDTVEFLKKYGSADPETGDRVEYTDGDPWVAGLLETLQGSLIWAEEPE